MIIVHIAKAVCEKTDFAQRPPVFRIKRKS